MFDAPPLAISCELIDSIAIIKFNHPKERNPLSTTTLHELKRLISEIVARADIASIILTGSEDVFASGANIKELTQLDSVTSHEFSRFGQDLFQSIASAKQVTIAAINGYCLGGALDLALACDMRVASHNAVFAHPGARLGIITGWGGTQRLPRIVGRTKSMELFLTARRFNAEEALKMGLITSIHDPVLDYALSLSKAIGRKTTSTEFTAF